MKLSHALVVGSLSLVVAGLTSPDARGETFVFGSGSQNNINGTASASLTKGTFTMQLLPALPGSLLSEVSSAGMGIDSTPVAGTGDGQPSLFNVLGGSGPLAETGEALQFSFLQSGVLTGINFDGVKDESLEYFVLESPGGGRMNFFDSAANTTIPGAVASAAANGAITGDVIYLLEVNSAIDDEAQNLHIPFAAGEQFTLTFRSLGPEFHPLLAANGARLQGVTVQSVPEPSGIAIAVGLALVSGFGLTAKRRTKGAPHSQPHERDANPRVCRSA